MIILTPIYDNKRKITTIKKNRKKIKMLHTKGAVKDS